MKMMTALLATALAVGTGLALPAPAQAAEGCGAGYHRGPAGRCRPNVRPGRVVIAPRLVVGRYYASRGYWDGRRYWRERYRHHNGWRYR